MVLYGCRPMAVPLARMTCFLRSLGLVIVICFAQSSPRTPDKTSCALDAQVAVAAKASFFAHGRGGAFAPRTCGLAQHDVQPGRETINQTVESLFLRPDQTPIGWAAPKIEAGIQWCPSPLPP
jgi:hypothetical protein